MKNIENANIMDLMDYLEADAKDLKEYVGNDDNDLAKALINFMISNLKDLKKEL